MKIVFSKNVTNDTFTMKKMTAHELQLIRNTDIAEKDTTINPIVSVTLAESLVKVMGEKKLVRHQINSEIVQDGSINRNAASPDFREYRRNLIL